MPDRRRGEVAVTLGGERCVLCLTLGALAELEEALGVADLPAVAERFAAGRPSSRDILAVLAARLRGGGRSLSDEAVAALPLADGVEPVARAVADLLVATFGSDGENPPQPQDA